MINIRFTQHFQHVSIIIYLVLIDICSYWCPSFKEKDTNLHRVKYNTIISDKYNLGQLYVLTTQFHKKSEAIIEFCTEYFCLYSFIWNFIFLNKHVTFPQYHAFMGINCLQKVYFWIIKLNPSTSFWLCNRNGTFNIYHNYNYY